MKEAETRSLLRRVIDSYTMRPGLRRVLSNFGWLSADRVLRMVVGLFVGVWLVRYLGPELFGKYSYAYALVTIFTPLATLGLNPILVRELVAAKLPRASLLGSALALRLIGAALALISAIAAALLLRGGDATVQILVAISALGLIIQSSDVIDDWFQSRLESRYAVVAKNAAFLTMSAAKIALILLNAPVTAFAWAGVAELALCATGLVAAYRLRGGRVTEWTLSPGIAARLMKPALPLILAGIAVSLYMRIDQLMIADMLGNHAVGQYAAAVRLCEATYFVPGIAATSVLPALVAARSDPTLYKLRMQRFFDVMAASALLIALPLSLLSAPLITLLYGPDYSPAAGVLAIYVWANVFVFLGISSSSFLVNENLTRISLYRTVVGATVNILLNLALIPRFGIAGAAWATLISYAVATYAVLVHPQSRVAGIMMIRALMPLRLLRGGNRA